FGTEEQKQKYLPRVAGGEISAFALTEVHAGSDPATLSLKAEPTSNGSEFVLNGEKLWCTNGVKAGVLVVMARTPSKLVGGKERKQITAFIVDVDTPGLEITYRCRFMGLRALYNAVVKFTNVRVPRENIISKEGAGLKVALTTLNSGRLTLPAACVGVSKRLLEISRKWAGERIQWGVPIGQHAAIAGKIAEMAGNVFAMEAMTFLSSSLLDRKTGDLRIETGMCKMWATETTWRIADDAMQVRGGRGYETAQSLAGRGEPPIAAERFLRDCRVHANDSRAACFTPWPDSARNSIANNCCFRVSSELQPSCSRSVRPALTHNGWWARVNRLAKFFPSRIISAGLLA